MPAGNDGGNTAAGGTQAETETRAGGQGSPAKLRSPPKTRATSSGAGTGNDKDGKGTKKTKPIKPPRPFDLVLSGTNRVRTVHCESLGDPTEFAA